MAYLAQQSRRVDRRHKRHWSGPFTVSLLILLAIAAIGAAFITYVLWPRWPDDAVSLDAPALPVAIGGAVFNIEPAAIRNAVQRRPGAQDRVDLVYNWPSFRPPGPARNATAATPVDPSERLFVTIQSGDATLPLMDRVQSIYPRYFAAEPATGPPGLTMRDFRADSPYAGEALVFESLKPEHFLARCSLRGVGNTGTCLLERRVGKADITVRFPREWLNDWQNVAIRIDTLINRLHPN